MPAAQHAMTGTRADLRRMHPALILAPGHPPVVRRHARLRQGAVPQRQLFKACAHGKDLAQFGRVQQAVFAQWAARFGHRCGNGRLGPRVSHHGLRFGFRQPQHKAQKVLHVFALIAGLRGARHVAVHQTGERHLLTLRLQRLRHE